MVLSVDQRYFLWRVLLNPTLSVAARQDSEYWVNSFGLLSLCQAKKFSSWSKWSFIYTVYDMSHKLQLLLFEKRYN